MALVTEGIKAWPPGTSAVIGSSLGGFYATLVAEATGWPAALLNPAVDPARDLAASIGLQTQFHAPDAQFYLQPKDVAALRAMTPAAITRPARYCAVIAKGDAVLDWREMTARYAGADIRLLEGSDHGLSDFDDDWPHVVRCLGLQAA